MAGADRDLDVLARTILGEARGESYDGKVAVGRTVVNRWRSKRWFAGRTIAATAQKRFQYSCWNRNDPNRAKILAARTDTALFQECLKAARDAMDGGGPAWLDAVTHYYAPRMVAPPKWAADKKPAGRIGGHLFFRDID